MRDPFEVASEIRQALPERFRVKLDKLMTGAMKQTNNVTKQFKLLGDHCGALVRPTPTTKWEKKVINILTGKKRE